MATLLQGARVIDGTGRPPVPRGCVVVEGGRIAYVGPQDGAPYRVGDTVVELPDCTLLPGLVDAHSHLGMDPGLGNQPLQLSAPEAELAARGTVYMRKDLRAGVTTLRTMSERYFTDVVAKRLVSGGVIPGPRLVISTRGIRPSNGHGASPVVVDGAENIRKAVRENLKAGADHIKLFLTGGMSSTGAGVMYCGYTKEEVAAAVDEAARAGKGVAVHAHGGPAVDISLETGVFSIEHGALLSPQQIEAVARKGAWVVLTMTLILHDDGLMKVDGQNPAIRERILLGREKLGETVHRMIQAGVRLAVGTDALHGRLAWEAEYLVQFGMRPLDAITCATRNGAEVCGVLDETGTLEVGKSADIIAVEGDPSAHIAVLRRVRLVMKQGERYDTLSPQ